jgi:integrase
MAKYGKNERGMYENSRTINGKRVKFRGKTIAEVDRKILEYNTERERGRKVPEIADEWFKMHLGKISNSTATSYAISLERIKKGFPCRAGEVRALDCQRYISQFEEQGYSKNTVQIELTVLRMIFAHAVLAGDIDANPAREVKMAKNLPQKKRMALTEEQEQLVTKCRKGEWWLLGLMLLYTGCRRGELLALNWSDIDRAAGVIHITKKLNYSYGNTPVLEDHLKSKNGLRDIPLFQPLDDVLPRNRIGRIFTDKNGNYLTKQKVRSVWEEYCEDAGLSEIVMDENGSEKQAPVVTPHSFRHSFATMCYEAGLDPKTTASIVGDTEQVVRDVYTELRKTYKASGFEKMNAFLAMKAAIQEENQA